MFCEVVRQLPVDCPLRSGAQYRGGTSGVKLGGCFPVFVGVFDDVAGVPEGPDEPGSTAYAGCPARGGGKRIGSIPDDYVPVAVYDLRVCPILYGIFPIGIVMLQGIPEGLGMWFWLERKAGGSYGGSGK